MEPTEVGETIADAEKGKPGTVTVVAMIGFCVGFNGRGIMLDDGVMSGGGADGEGGNVGRSGVTAGSGVVLAGGDAAVDGSVAGTFNDSERDAAPADSKGKPGTP